LLGNSYRGMGETPQLKIKSMQEMEERYNGVAGMARVLGEK